MKNKKTIIHDEILKEIINGGYPVNTIISERMLIEKYKVSKSPVREALVELCNEKILNSIPRSGYQVVPITPRELMEMVEMRMVIELAAFEKTFEQLNNHMIDALVKHEESFLLDGSHDVVRHWKKNTEFHLLLCGYCGNRWMYQTLEMALTFCSRGARQYYSDNWDNTKEAYRVDGTAHLLLIEALKKRDYTKCRDILKKDILSMRENLFNMF